MSSQQVRAAEILLRKTLPDMQAIKYTAEMDGQITVLLQKFAGSDEYYEQNNPENIVKHDKTGMFAQLVRGRFPLVSPECVTITTNYHKTITSTPASPGESGKAVQLVLTGYTHYFIGISL